MYGFFFSFFFSYYNRKNNPIGFKIPIGESENFYPLLCMTIITLCSSFYLQVITGTKDHALYLWIHLRSEADVKACARVVADLQSHVDAVCPPDMRDEDDEVLAGVGFGPGFYAKVSVRANFHSDYKWGCQNSLPLLNHKLFTRFTEPSKGISYPVGDRYRRFIKLTGPTAYILL